MLDAILDEIGVLDILSNPVSAEMKMDHANACRFHCAQVRAPIGRRRALLLPRTASTDSDSEMVKV